MNPTIFAAQLSANNKRALYLRAAMRSGANVKSTENRRVKAVTLVVMMVSMTLISFVPAASASQITQYAVQRDPHFVATGDLDCDGDDDIAASSSMGFYLTSMFNDGAGGFPDRQDIFIAGGVGDSQRQSIFQTANSQQIEIADIDGDQMPDIVYFQENVRFVGETFVRPANLTVLWGECNMNTHQWSRDIIEIPSHPFSQGMDVGDIDDDGDDDIILATMTPDGGQTYLEVFKGPDPGPQADQTILVPAPTYGHYSYIELGQWGEDLAEDPFTGATLPGECEDLDLWVLRTPRFNPGAGYSVGNYDNMTVIEFDCVTGLYADPNVGGSAAAAVHDFTLDAEHGYELQIDVEDTDGDGIIDMVAAVDGIEGRVSYATRSGVNSNWDTRNYINLGNYKGASITISDVNGDGNMDFFVPTELTLTRLQDSSSKNQTYTTVENLRELNSVEIILSDGQGTGYLSPISFDVGRRPTVAVPAQLKGDDSTAQEIIIGQRDYSYRFSSGAMWMDSLGWPGAGDFLSVLTLDNQDVAIDGLTIAPASTDPATGSAQLGEGTRFVNVTLMNTGLNPVSGSVNLDLAVKEVTGGADTVVYSNDFDGTIESSNCSSCTWAGASYTSDFSPGTSWHEERNSTALTENVSTYEADHNPTNYMWAGLDYNGTDENNSGYFNNMDEAFILQNVDLTGADAAFLEASILCSVAYTNLFLSEPYVVQERWLYEDSCGIEAFSEGRGWERVWFQGGYDQDRYFNLLALNQDPEYEIKNFAIYPYFITEWTNYTEGGSEDNLTNTVESIDLTPYAGEVIDLRFRFRSGLLGSVGTVDTSYDTGFDGFAFDNITVIKRNTAFGEEQSTSQQVSFQPLAAGEKREISLSAEFIDNKTYYISTALSNFNGFVDQDPINDALKFQTTVRNLYDPGLTANPFVDFEPGVRYASAEYPIDVRVQNFGNTIVNWTTEAEIFNALPDLTAIEDFSGINPIWTDDNDQEGKENGSRLDDSTTSNQALPQNQGVFKNFAYWLGDPDIGYGDNWDETLTVGPVAVSQTDSDYTYASWDYYAEGDYLQDQFGNVLAVRDSASLTVDWTKSGQSYTGLAYGSWVDLNENGVQRTNPEDPNFHACEDFDSDGNYDEAEYFGDRSDQGNYIVWFDSESIVKSVVLDLTHIVIQNRTSEEPQDWRDECTSLADAEVTLTWRFTSNGDGVNGNAGLAGFAIDNIRFEEFTFEDDGNYSVPVNGLDSQEEMTVSLGTHDFDSGLYRIDVRTIFDNNDPTQKWYLAEEVNPSNNFSKVQFSIDSAEITLLQPNVLDCVGDVTYECVYPISPTSAHTYSLPILNGVIEGIYEVTMTVVDTTTGQTVWQANSDNGPFDLVPHQRTFANWSIGSNVEVGSSGMFNSWEDSRKYNLSWAAKLVSDDSDNGNVRFFEITFMDDIDVAILSNPTDQNRLQRVKSDLEAMGMVYTQFRTSEWEDYVTQDWAGVYDKILLPWQTDYNAEYGEYYQKLNELRGDGLSTNDVLDDFMVNGGTLQVHLGPYRNDYVPDNLPFGMDIQERDPSNSSIRFDYEDVRVIDRYHPLLSNIELTYLQSVHAGQYVARSGLDISQVQPNQVPSACGGRISDPLGTFHSLLGSVEYGSQSLLSLCNRGNGGMIVTTMDVENPSFSEPYGSESMPLLSNMLGYSVTPYPVDFGIAGDTFDLTINGEAPSINTVTKAYNTVYIKSNSQLQFSYVSEQSDLIADWTLEPGGEDSVTGWDSEIVDPGEYSWVSQTSADLPTLGSFCVEDTLSSTGCFLGAEWLLTLYLHDAEGHTRMTYVRLITNDTLADESDPTASISMVQDSLTDEFVTTDGTKTVGGVEWDVYRVRLTPTGDISLSFTGADSIDPDAPEGETGIQMYSWRVYFDYPATSQPSLEGHLFEVPALAGGDAFTYTFRNVTSDGVLENQIRLELIVYDKAGKDSSKARMYFVVVGEDYGDDPPVVSFSSPKPNDSQTDDRVTISGTVVSGAENSDVRIQVALDAVTLDLSPTPKNTQKAIGKYNETGLLGDGASFSITLDISDLYSETDGVLSTVYIRIIEGDGVRYTTTSSEDIYLLKRSSDPCERDPSSDGCDTEGQGLGLIIPIVGALLLVLAIAGVTLSMRGRGSSAVSDEIRSFQGVEDMDPVEAYVQQMVGQGYPEDYARQYAQDYYANLEKK